MKFKEGVGREELRRPGVEVSFSLPRGLRVPGLAPGALLPELWGRGQSPMRPRDEAWRLQVLPTLGLLLLRSSTAAPGSLLSTLFGS